jgi:hypothetical protein
MSVVLTRVIYTVCGALLIGAAMTGCGRAGTGATSPAAGAGPGHGGLCASLASVRLVRLARIPSINQLEPSKPLPTRLPEMTIADPAKAIALARAVCALPQMPHQVFNCPIDFGGGYRLAFAGAGGRRLPGVSLQTGGCGQVTGAGPTRWTAHSPAFWSAFGRATGITVMPHFA